MYSPYPKGLRGPNLVNEGLGINSPRLFKDGHSNKTVKAEHLVSIMTM